MPHVASTERIRPSRLAPDEKARLGADLYAVHCQIFDGVDQDSFVHYVIDSSAEDTILQLHRDASGRLCGYFAIHAFEVTVDGRGATVFRAEAGTARAYRGANLNARFLIRRLVRHFLTRPGRPAYYLGSLVHPSSYALFAKSLDEVWPREGCAVPPAIQRMMEQLADRFGLAVVDPARPLVRKVGWRTRDTDEERGYWAHSDKPAVRFFVRENPGYPEGHGLLTLAPLTPSGIARAALRRAAEAARLLWEAAVATLQRVPIGKQLLRPRAIRKALAQASLFAHSGPAQLAELAGRAQIVSVPAGRYLLTQNEPGDEVYLLLRGAAYVLLRRRGSGVAGAPVEEHVVDELSRGAVFGEIAMLSGERRSASVRTATASTLLRIDRATLQSLMDADPDLKRIVWQAFAERRFDDYARTLGPFASLGRKSRLEWIHKGSHHELAEGESTAIEPGAFLLVLTGEVEITQEEQDGAQMVTRAPTLIEVKGKLTVTARAPSRVVRVPRP